MTTTTTTTTQLILRMDKVQVDYIGDPLSSAAKYVHTCAHTHTHTHSILCVCILCFNSPPSSIFFLLSIGKFIIFFWLVIVTYDS